MRAQSAGRILFPLILVVSAACWKRHIDAADAASEATFDEVVRTWEWSDDAAET